MEIPRHWRLKKQRYGLVNLITNPVINLGMTSAIDQSVSRQDKELKPIREQIQKEEAIEDEEAKVKAQSSIIFSSSK